ncbi:TetR/AcrR family transcriptional regulator [Rhodovibrionaceae bacterium A322]
MPKLSDARKQILEQARRLAQTRGYGGFSYRDIAQELGIKSASIHYHFPGKDDLIAALIDAYSDAVFDILEDEAVALAPAKEKLEAFTRPFRTALEDGNKMCLCGMLSAEAELLSDEARQKVQAFFDRCEAWLEDVYRELEAADPASAATTCVASLEGALLLARARGSMTPFNQVVARLLAG